MSFWRRLGAGLGKPARWGALASGALPVLAFPAPNIEFLAWFGLVPGLLLMRAASSAREAAVRAWWFGAGFIMAAHYWLIPTPIQHAPSTTATSSSAGPMLGASQ